MNNIIKKLGIKRPDYTDGIFIQGDGNWIEYETYLKLEQQRNELLEALCEVIKRANVTISVHSEEINNHYIPIIQKIDPQHRTKEQIREIIC